MTDHGKTSSSDKAAPKAKAATALVAVTAPPVSGSFFLALALGSGLSVGVYSLLFLLRMLGQTQTLSQHCDRYFLGHPVSVAATVLFCFACGTLIAKTLGVTTQNGFLDRIRDRDLLPASDNGNSPAKAWLDKNDAGHVARNWLDELSRLPNTTRSSHLVTRLQEVLTRQSQRGSSKNLSDDLRELAGRDADAAHDSLGLVRIIVWAIPMLGFLGTVIGITQTLGGLDFSSGTAAVDNLKSGLYVAFDTTAIGIVLSVLAIFLQFPVERSEQRLLGAVDARVGHLVSSTLPSDEASDNQTVLIAELCRGVQAAVAESLANQATLWRDTIDSAQSQWQGVHEKNNTTLADAFELTLAPALLNHANMVTRASQLASDTLGKHCDRWQQTLQQTQGMLEQSRRASADQIQAQTLALNETVDDVCETLSTQQQTLAGHYESINHTHDAISRLTEATNSLQHQMAHPNNDGMADAMRILARAVDVLSSRLVSDNAISSSPKTPIRRAA